MRRSTELKLLGLPVLLPFLIEGGQAQGQHRLDVIAFPARAGELEALLDQVLARPLISPEPMDQPSLSKRA